MWHCVPTTCILRETAEKNMAAWQCSTCIDCNCSGDSLTVKLISILFQKHGQDKKKDTCWQMALNFILN